MMPRKRRHRAYGGLALLWLLALLVFGVWPDLDVHLSRRIWSPEAGFYLRELTWVQVLYRGVPWVGRGLLVLMALVLIGHHLGAVRSSRCRLRMASALVLSTALASGLVVEEGLKNHWGRPRPIQVLEFGGPHAYTPPLHPSSACTRNCSMASGHAAGAFLLMSLGALAPLRRRRFWLAVGMVVGLLTGLGRIMQGAHFASDIVFSGLIVGLTCTVLRTVWVAQVARRRAVRAGTWLPTGRPVGGARPVRM